MKCKNRKKSSFRVGQKLEHILGEGNWKKRSSSQSSIDKKGRDDLNFGSNAKSFPKETQ
jgi:hypothetical protein